VLPWWLLTLLIFAVVLTAAAGYVVNDYFDVKIDRINRPDQLIITQTVSKDSAMMLYRVLAVSGALLGLLVAWFTRSWAIATIFLFVPGLLWFYSSSYKRQFLLGNLIIAFASSLSPLLVGLTNAAWLELQYPEVMPYVTTTRDVIVWTGGFSIFAFLMTWIREGVKDLQDQNGDRELECHTMPIVLGETWTKIMLTGLIVLTAGLMVYFWYALLPMPHTWGSLTTRYLIFGLLIPLACEIWLLWAAKISSDYRHAQLLMKFIMFLGVLFSFVIARTL
jgi:4-hydroxybenzoate polyprenyltransferase